jgi:hypothetical protein
MAGEFLMKASTSVFFLCVFLASAGRALAAPLPDSCGDPKIKFDVKTEKDKHPISASVPGKATIVFLERENQMVVPFSSATVRFGIDGSWIGADYSNSYFALDVAPGVHHICASWQTALRSAKSSTDLTSLTVEPGKVYYIAATVTVRGEYGGIGFDLTPIDADKAKFWVAQSKRSISKPK